MKSKVLMISAILLLMSAVASAQNTLTDTNNDACWQSLSSLRGCQIAQQEREMDYAQRCTSYPEYQCLPATNQDDKNPERARKTKKSKTNATQEPASPSNGPVAVSAGSNAN